MDKRELFGTYIIYIVLFFWAGVSVILNSTIKTFLFWNKEDVNTFVDYATLVLLITNIVFFQKYTKRDIFIIAVGTLLVGYTAIVSNYNTLMAVWIFVVSAKHVDFEKTIRAVYFSQLFAFFVVLYMFFSGYIEEHTMYRGSILRHSLGFSHPNQLGVTVFLLVTYRLYGRKSRTGFFDIFVLVVLAYFVKVVPNSKTSHYALVILAIIVLAHVITERIGLNLDSASNVFIAIAICSNLLSVFMSLIDVEKIDILRKVDSLMSVRFSLCHKTYNYYGIKWFGQDVQLFVRKVALGKYYHFWLDNAYMALLLRYGIVVYFLFSIVYIWAMIIQKKMKNYVLVELMCLYAIYGIMENNFFSISQNLFLLLLGYPLFNRFEMDNPSDVSVNV